MVTVVHSEIVGVVEIHFEIVTVETIQSEIAGIVVVASVQSEIAGIVVVVPKEVRANTPNTAVAMEIQYQCHVERETLAAALL